MAAKKDQSKQTHEKHQAILSKMLRDEDNKYCVDCDAKGPRWASWNLGVFLCIRCAGIHRNLGVHISKVKSINLDSWSPEQLAMMEDMGNSRARAVYEANLSDNFKRPASNDSAMEQFIRAKYEHKLYIAKEWVPPKPRSAPSHYYEADTETTKKEPKKPILTVPGAAAGTQAAAKAKQVKFETPLPAPSTEQKPPQNDLLGDLSAPVTNPAPTQTSKPQSSSDLLTDIFASPSTNGNLAFNNALGTTSQAPANIPGGDNSVDLFLAADEKTKSTKDSILALYGNAAPQQPMQMQGSLYGQQMYVNGPQTSNPFMPNPGMVGGYPMTAQQGMYRQTQPSMVGAMHPGMMGMAGVPQPNVMGNPQLGMMGTPQYNMMGNTQSAMLGGAHNSLPGAQYSQQQQQMLYTQQLQAQMANMTLNQQKMPQQVPVMAGGPGASWSTTGKPQTNGQTLNFDLWN